MISEVEAVKRERKAFVNGAAYATCCGPSMTDSRAAEEAKGQYPLPKVTRPRVVTDTTGCHKWRCVDGELEVTVNGRDWTSPSGCKVWYPPTLGRVKLWVDLFANPTEEVDAE